MLHETFTSHTLDPRLHWHCAPASWQVLPEQGCLELRPAASTDFWQRTHYGFQADNGHFLFAQVRGDFVLATHVRFAPVHQYDQAGLMIRISPECWLKTSIEYEGNEPARLGAVVTHAGWSDWSTQDVPSSTREAWLRVRSKAGDYIVEASLDGARYSQIRMAHLHADSGDISIQAGLYACCPKGAGYVAWFSELTIDQA